MKTGIIGASGYSGELLVKLTTRHPQVELAAVTSRKLAGTPVVDAIPALRETGTTLRFTASDPEALAADSEIDLYFLALPHGVATEFARPLFDAGKRIIDLSADYRLNSAAVYEEFYGAPHPDPALLEASAYVIPELADDTWKALRLIASPGCYPTSVQVPLVPLLRAGVIAPDGIVINAFSGVSGAGKKATGFFSYCERSESAMAYGAPKHRHLSEIEEQLSGAAGQPVIVQFTPHLAPMRRGIATTIVAKPVEPGTEAVYAAWQAAYGEAPFITVLDSGKFPDTAEVTGSNRAEISAVYDVRTGNLVITSAIDNLMKGASGQAIQIMNRWYGFGETDGLV